MNARLVLLGDGTDEDSYRIDLPNYTAITTNTDESWAEVAFPLRDAPPQLPEMGGPLYPLVGALYILIGLTPEQLLAWHARLATRYPFRQPPYAPDFP